MEHNPLDPLAGIKGLVTLAAFDVANAAVAWEKSNGDVVPALMLRKKVSHYERLAATLSDMQKQLDEIKGG